MSAPSPECNSIAIVIVTYQSAVFLKPLMESLLPEISGRPVTVCCVDNHSTDQTLQELERLQKETGIPHRILPLSENVGLSAANNEGLRFVESDQAHSTFVFLNPDTVVMPGWLKGLCEPLQNPKIGATQSLALLPNGKINTRGGGIHFLGFGYTTGLYEDDTTPSPSSSLGYCSGVSMALSRKTVKHLEEIEETGRLFWDPLFLYCEDVELGWRLSLLGYENHLAVGSRLVHHYDFFTKRSHDLQFFYMERNRWLLLLSLYRIHTLIILFPFLLATEIGLSLFYRDLMKVRRFNLYLEILKMIRERAFRSHRKAIQSHRVQSDREILRLRNFKIQHPGIDQWNQENQTLTPLRKILDPLIHSLLKGTYLFLRLVVRW